MKRIALLLALTWVFFLWGCTTANPSDGGNASGGDLTEEPILLQPSEPSVTDGDWTEETLPTLPFLEINGCHIDLPNNLPSDAVLEASDFVVCSEFTPSYRYVGTSNTIVFPECGVTLTLPDGWLEQVTVTWFPDCFWERDNWHGYVACNAILQAHIHADFPERKGETISLDEPYTFAFDDCVLEIVALSKTGGYNLTRQDGEHITYLGEDEDYCYYLNVLEPNEEIHRNEELLRHLLIQHIGEEAYWSMVEDFLLTPEEAKQMITIHEPLE